MSQKQPAQNVFEGYIVQEDNRPPRPFSTSMEAVRYIAQHPGPLRVYSPAGGLIMTKGTIRGN